MKVQVNGKEHEINAGIDGQALLAQFEIPESTVVVELNGEICARKDFLARTVEEGDSIELVTIVGGG